ncbi:MAG: acryloyl-CoA reductase [Alphaproteobacteria bacterium]|nr:acryloyl-CoA reductase [Alphaproteobacteria bacterium]
MTAAAALQSGRFGRVLVARLRPNQDMVGGIEALCAEHSLHHAVVRSGVGSLVDAALAYGAAATPKRLDITGPGIEILSLQGEVAPDKAGNPRADLRGTISDSEARVYGGTFVAGANPICITLELVLQEWLPTDEDKMSKTFRALMLEETGGKVSASIQDVDEARLPAGDVTVRVSHSTLNYKDGLILNGLGRLVRNYPHVPGVDFAGTVEASEHKDFKPGDAVVLTGWRVGEAQWGGYATRARVKGDWLVKLPANINPARAMAIGTAGFTSMMSIIALEQHGLTPAGGDVAVTGAAGGVGSVALAILAKLGYRAVASTGRADTHDYLKSLGAAEIVDRSLLANPSGKPLESERWAGAIDSVGGTTLASLLTQMKYRGTVAACGLAGGNELKTTVIPFLLRGIKLIGIDSVMCPQVERHEIWRRLAQDLPLDKLDAMTETVGLGDLTALAGRILKGGVRGRIVVEVER